ncbi:MAG: hypothetical protein MUD14_01880 [Hydrococcus sp. Prado102]|jgi:hypothetical protein|nr:hypothetical protein [Hydrococcus sp. Prado102]
MNKLLLLTISTFLTFSTPIYSQTNNPSNNIQNNLSFPKSSQEPSNIVGLWRGYREEKDFAMFYGYEFRSNGTYIARHRVYRGEETIQDETWQGQWELDNDLLYLNGESIANERRKVRVRFNIVDNNTLNYEGGTLLKPYLPLKLQKQSRSP